MRRNLLSFCFFAVCASFAPSAQAQNLPSVLVLGDSQISFGAGEVYLDFFGDLPQHCDPKRRDAKLLKKLGKNGTVAMGVRSTSLHSWIARKGSAKGTICDVDKKYGVNAGVYGVGGNEKRQFVQIGKGKNYQFCAPGKSPFETAFERGNYRPNLVVLSFLGNSAKRWANTPDLARQDVQRTISQIPKDIPCVFLTTAPVFSKNTNDLRNKAQDVIVDAFERSKGHCKAVKGLTPQTRAAIEGQAKFFRRNDAGRVTDPLHPRPAATRQFLELITPKLCDAVIVALRGK